MSNVVACARPCLQCETPHWYSNASNACCCLYATEDIVRYCLYNCHEEREGTTRKENLTSPWTKSCAAGFGPYRELVSTLRKWPAARFGQARLCGTRQRLCHAALLLLVKGGIGDLVSQWSRSSKKVKDTCKQRHTWQSVVERREVAISNQIVSRPC